MMDFEWNSARDLANQKKHGVALEEAKSAFFDEEHSEEENHFIMLGMSNESRVLIVCHCERNEGSTIRIISARKATKKESSFYPKGAS
jgi:uncharacterized DUF497 family protein